MADRFRLVDLVDARIDEFISDRSSIILSIGPDLAPLTDFSRRFLSGGKRFRALFCYWGWQSVAGREGLDPFADVGETDLDSVVSAAAALEIFHAAALVHDDIIDNSDTRRGSPAAHRLFESTHLESGWAGDADAFGRSSAILLGDLLLGWSDELLDVGLEPLGRDRARATRAEFMHMRTEVTAGQYLDILEEQAWVRQQESEMRSRAERVIVYKSAKYSIQAPLLIGAAIGGATLDQRAALRDFGLPLGIAYQLRDDMLGVFGDSAVTGKPSGDDLREGKRTVLVALARERLAAGPRNVLDELLGDPTLGDEQVRMLQRTLTECGAVDAVEALIEEQVSLALAALEGSTLTRAAIDELTALTKTVTRRSS